MNTREQYTRDYRFAREGRLTTLAKALSLLNSYENLVLPDSPELIMNPVTALAFKSYQLRGRNDLSFYLKTYRDLPARARGSREEQQNRIRQLLIPARRRGFACISPVFLFDKF